MRGRVSFQSKTVSSSDFHLATGALPRALSLNCHQRHDPQQLAGLNQICRHYFQIGCEILLHRNAQRLRVRSLPVELYLEGVVRVWLFSQLLYPI